KSSASAAPMGNLNVRKPGREYAKRNAGHLRANSALTAASAPTWQVIKTNLGASMLPILQHAVLTHHACVSLRFLFAVAQSQERVTGHQVRVPFLKSLLGIDPRTVVLLALSKFIEKLGFPGMLDAFGILESIAA